jgi:hypothetical protein
MQAFRGTLAAVLLTFVARCGAQPAQVTLAWNGDTSSAITGFYLVWGLSSGNYTVGTNMVPVNSIGLYDSTVTLTNANPGDVYYFNVQSYNGSAVSAYVNEVVYTNIETAINSTPGLTNLAVTTNSVAGATNSSGPPTPTGNLVTNSGNSSSTNLTGATQTSNTNLSQSLFWGVPPFVTMAMGGGQANLSIGGTVGATLMLESTTNIFSMDEWTEVTNINITNIAPVALTNPAVQNPDALDLAFVPGLQTLAVPLTNSAPQYFRVVMQYDYVILASMVLPSKNCTPRLILVNMPGVVCDDVCYVNESSSFIHIDRSAYALQLQGSGSTIRNIATQLAGSLNLDWTSASEFSYSNGLCQILATVVETEPASSDPVAGQTVPGAPIVINF